MNSFKRKALTCAVLAGLGAMVDTVKATAKATAWLVLGPVHDYYMNPRNGLVKADSDAKAIAELTETFTTKLKEFKVDFEKNREQTEKAIEEVKKINTIEAKTADALKEMGEKVVKAQAEVKETSEKLAARLLDIEQKTTKHTQELEQHRNGQKSAGTLFAESDALKNFVKNREKQSTPLDVPSQAMFMGGMKTAIVNATYNNDQPLVRADRLPGIYAPPRRRLTVRDLLPQIPTGSNVIEFARELVFTNNAGPQGGLESPTSTNQGETAPKNESGITFELANAVVITLAHWIPASRQVLSDAPALAGYIDSRLGYGLKLEEEDELLNSNGTAGELNGLRNQSTAFSGGVTNATALDTLLRAFTQVQLSDYEATGVVLHPTDWMNIQLLKDTTGRYLFSDPHGVEAPRVWGKPVVATASMTAGQFVTGAFDLGAAIYDREGMTIRVAEQHADFFVRNMVAILCEERLAFVVYRSAAFVAGGLSYAG